MKACHIFLRRPLKYDRSTNIIGKPIGIHLSWIVENISSVHYYPKWIKYTKKIRQLKEKDKKVGEEQHHGREVDEEEEMRKLKAKWQIVILDTNKYIFKEVDKDEPMLLIKHAFLTNDYNPHIPHYIFFLL